MPRLTIATTCKSGRCGEPISKGVASFDAAFSGAFPFRAESVDAALALLHGLQPVATHASMGIVVEDDDALDQRVVDAGRGCRCGSCTCAVDCDVGCGR